MIYEYIKYHNYSTPKLVHNIQPIVYYYTVYALNFLLKIPRNHITEALLKCQIIPCRGEHGFRSNWGRRNH